MLPSVHLASEMTQPTLRVARKVYEGEEEWTGMHGALKILGGALA